jgi:hypothetical protein
MAQDRDSTAGLVGFFHSSRVRVWRAAGQHGLFVVAPVIVSLLTLRAAVRTNAVGVDFVHGPWVAGAKVLDGMTPYVSPHSHLLREGLTFVYPAAAAVLAIPFSILPQLSATILFMVLSVAAVIGTLRLCGVGDWRVYGAVFLWPAVTSGLQTANLTLVVGLGLAAAWRYRDRAFVTGAVIALLISIKLFVWPLAFWLLATRRYAAFVWTVVGGLAINLVAWTIVGFDQISRFLRLLSANTKVLNHLGYSVMALAGGEGHSSSAVLALALILAGALVGCAFILGCRNQDTSAFALCILAALIASPIVWLHYFSLLMLPLALTKPRVSAWWLVPVLLWFPITTPSTWQLIATLAVSCAVTIQAISTKHRPLLVTPEFTRSLDPHPARAAGAR